MADASEVLLAVDYDRTIFRTDRAAAALFDIAADVTGISKEELLTAKRATEGSGGSFDVMGFLVSIGTEQATLTDIRKAFIEFPETDQWLYPNALPFIERSKAIGKALLIVTFGGQDWQSVKLQAPRLDYLPHLITDNKYKGELIASWQERESGLYVPVGVDMSEDSFESVILVDDKADAFRGLPNDCAGFLLQRPDEGRLASQSGEVPPNVIVVSGLMAVTEQLEIAQTA